MMYEKPIVLSNEDLAEGVYATSLSGPTAEGTCWKMLFREVDSNRTTTNPGWNKTGWKIDAEHGNVQHISYSTTMWLTFGGEPIQRVEIEGVSVVSGESGHSYDTIDNQPGLWRFEVKVTDTTIEIKRRCHGNAYQGGVVTDQFTIDLLVYCATGSATITSLGWDCEHKENVQGGYD